MNTDSLRILWELVDRLSPDRVAGISYDVLVGGLLQQLDERLCLSPDEDSAVRLYLKTRELLVRELVMGHAS